MRCCGILLLAPGFLAISLLGSAQDVIPVDKIILNYHIDHKVHPVYPPIAKAAHVAGTVEIAVQIGVTGKVESLKVISGPAMLQQSGLDAVKQWTFHPFIKGGKAFVASGIVSLEFILDPKEPSRREQKIIDRYEKLARECSKALSAQSDYPAAATACKQAADTAEEFAPDVRFIEKRSVFVWAAWAFLYSGDLKTAFIYAGKAVDVVKLGHDDNVGSNAAYGAKGIVESKLGELTDADQDLITAEDYGRKEITWAEQVGFESSDRYKKVLAQELRIHAQVLQGLNRLDEAQKKLDEAAKYN
jgi:TonB family protein